MLEQSATEFFHLCQGVYNDEIPYPEDLTSLEVECLRRVGKAYSGLGMSAGTALEPSILLDFLDIAEAKLDGTLPDLIALEDCDYNERVTSFENLWPIKRLDDGSVVYTYNDGAKVLATKDPNSVCPLCTDYFWFHETATGELLDVTIGTECCGDIEQHEKNVLRAMSDRSSGVFDLSPPPSKEA